MQNLKDFSAIIFDLDGLVLDTEGSYFAAWKMAAAQMGFELEDAFLYRLSGLHYQAVKQAITTHCGEGFDVDEFTQRSSACWHERVQVKGIEVKPGVYMLLDWIKRNGIPFCLATNSHSDNARQCLELARLQGIFNIIIGREQVKQGKPDPDIFKYAADRLNVPVRKCLVLEDSLTGIKAAKSAGAISVFIPSYQPANIEAVNLADYTLDSLAQLVELLE